MKFSRGKIVLWQPVAKRYELPRPTATQLTMITTRNVHRSIIHRNSIDTAEEQRSVARCMQYSTCAPQGLSHGQMTSWNVCAHYKYEVGCPYDTYARTDIYIYVICTNIYYVPRYLFGVLQLGFRRFCQPINWLFVVLFEFSLSLEGCLTVNLHQIRWNANLTQECNLLKFL